MAATSRLRLLQLPCSADEQSRTLGLPIPCHRPMATGASTPQPEGRLYMGTDNQAGRRLAPQTSNPSPLAGTTICRQAPKVGAGCLNWARPDLCGRPSVMPVPTALREIVSLYGAMGSFPRSRRACRNAWLRWTPEFG